MNQDINTERWNILMKILQEKGIITQEEVISILLGKEKENK